MDVIFPAISPPESTKFLIEKKSDEVLPSTCINPPKIKNVSDDSSNRNPASIIITKEIQGKKDTNIVCFLHSCNLSIWGTEILDDMVSHLKRCGLMDSLKYLFINNVGSKLDANIYSSIDPKIIVTNYCADSNIFENCTLRQLYLFSQFNPDYKILYLHTKGVSYPKNHEFVPGILDWSRFMLYCLTDKYRECLEILDYVDTVGCNYRTGVNCCNPSHFSGNFWWATSNYIRTTSVYELTLKHDAEFWLFRGDPSFVNIHTCPYGNYENTYKIDQYADIVSMKLKYIISNLKSQVTILYGTDGFYLDVTRICHEKLRKGNFIKITAGDSERNHIFGDPVVGRPKHIRIGNMKYDIKEDIAVYIPSPIIRK